MPHVYLGPPIKPTLRRTFFLDDIVDLVRRVRYVW